MTPDRALIAALVDALANALTRTWHGEKHQENCRRGYWYGAWAFGDGAPCSEKCSQAQRALAWGRQWLAETAPRQDMRDPERLGEARWG